MTQVQTQPLIVDYPVRRETNRERIIRALKEADGVVPQCRKVFYDTKGGYCAIGWVEHCLTDKFGMAGELGLDDGRVFDLNDSGYTFAQIADVLESDPSYWNEQADLPYEAS